MSNPKIAKDTLLATDFRPGRSSVICGRGRDNYYHVGNKNFRALLVERRDEYMRTTSRTTKSKIVIDLVRQFRERFQREENRSDSLGAFVRKDSKSGRWYDVGDACAREKVGRTLRDPERTRDSNDTPPLSSFRRRSRSSNLPSVNDTTPEPNFVSPATFQLIEQIQKSMLANLVQQERIMSNQLVVETPSSMEFDNDSIQSLTCSDLSLFGDDPADDENDFGALADSHPEDVFFDEIEL